MAAQSAAVVQSAAVLVQQTAAAAVRSPAAPAAAVAAEHGVGPGTSAAESDIAAWVAGEQQLPEACCC